MLVGVVAGTVTASTAFRPAPSVEVAGDRVMTPPPAVAEAPPEPSPAPPVGNLRVNEAAFAEYVYRASLPPQVSRSTNTPGSLIRPARGAMTGWWGEGRRSHRHAGIDFDGETGDPVVAAGAGTVVHAGGAPAGYSGYGQMVLIDHGNGVQTLYAHLSRIGVRHGAEVAPGDDVGAIGTTGNVTGSHLHFEVRYGGRPVNPSDWIAG